MPDSEMFSRITSLATATLGCPVALVAIVEAERHWLLGRSGVGPGVPPIAAPFCRACVDTDAPLLVDDAAGDPRFAGNLADTGTGALPVRACLGVPIRFEGGAVLGTLCAMSPQPGAFAPDQIKPLEMLAELVEQKIALYARTRELHRKNATLREAARVFHHAEMAANIGFWRVDLASGALHWSDQAHVIHGLEPEREQIWQAARSTGRIRRMLSTGWSQSASRSVLNGRWPSTARRIARW